MDMWGQDCKTAACIAGWACRISRVDGNALSSIGCKARNLIGITNAQSERLFYEDSWPVEFIVDSTDSSNALAKAASARIERFIETDGKE